jgi:hypothetical protein
MQVRMIDRAFLHAGHAPTLFAAFFYFDISFMVWVLLGPLGVQIAAELHLNAAQKSLMVAVPILAGALCVWSTESSSIALVPNGPGHWASPSCSLG